MNLDSPYTFEVHRIAVEELADVDTLVVGLSENNDGDGEVLLFQIALSGFDEQDRKLGMDTYSVSTAWGATYYGGVTHCILQDNVLDIGFSDEAASALGIRECRMDLLVDQEAITQLLEGLRRVLLNSPTPPEQFALYG